MRLSGARVEARYTMTGHSPTLPQNLMRRQSKLHALRFIPLSTGYSMSTGNRLAGAAYLVITYLVLQTFIVIAHEFAHSTSAWLLGYTPSPFTVVWGNPITMKGWDEGIPYDQLFPMRGNFAEAVIGGMPLFLRPIVSSSSILPS